MANHPALVAITPQTPHQNNISFIKNITTRSSFCGTPTSMNHSLVSNRKSWNGNGTLPLQATNCHIDISPIEDNPTPPVLATFKSGTGTFPRKNQRDADNHSRENNQRILTNFASQRSSNNGNAAPSFEYGIEPNVESRGNFSNGDHEVSTPNGNTVTAGSRANDMKRAAGNARRYAEIGNWSARSSTFLEPHIQGVGWRTAPDSDRGQEDHSTEDDEQLLIKEEKPSHQTKKPFIFHRDIPDTAESERDHKSRAEQLRERFEQKQASKKDEVDGNRPQDRRSQEVENVKRMAKEFLENSLKDEGRGRDGSQKNARNESKEFRPIPAADFRDSLSQSRESLSSRNSVGAGGSDADGDCECDSSGGSCSPASGSGSGSAERVPCDIGLLERLLRTHPVWFLPGIQRAGAFHLLQGKEEGNFVVRQSSQTDTMALSVRLPVSAGPYIEHYLIHAAAGRIGLETSQNKFDNIPDLVAHYSQCCDELPVQLVLPRALRDAKNRQQLSSLALLGQEFWRYPMACPRPGGGTLKGEVLPGAPTPMSQTPSDTSSSFSSFSAGILRTPHVAEADSNIVLNLTPVDNPCSSQGVGCSMSTFKGTSSPPSLAVSRVMGSTHEGSAFIRAPRPTPPNTLNLLSSTESDILESPGVYYRSSLGDKASDYEDIWGPEQGGPQGPVRSTFRPQRDTLGSGMLISKRPDLLPDTLPKVLSLNSNILSPSSPITTDNDSDKEHHQFMALKLAAQQKLAHQNSLESAEKASMIIATTNSKGEAVPKRPDKLNLMKNANEQMTNDTNERLKQSEFVGRTDEEIERENHKKNISTDECLLLTSDFCNSTDDDLQTDKQNSPFYADPVDAIKEAVAPLVQRRRVVRGMPGIGPAQRYSEPPTHGHPYLPLRDMQSIEELSPSSPNTSSSVDNLAGMKSGRPRGKAVLPPRIKPVPVRQDQTWTVDSSWEFISKHGDMIPLQHSGCREGGDGGVHGSAGGGAFPSLAEQLTRLDSAHPGGDTLTIHQVLAQRFPELNLSPYPTMLKSTGEVESFHDPPEDPKGCRMSSYDNVENRLAVSSQASDDGTVFNEPWDCSHWDSLLPPHSGDEPLSLLSSQTYDAEEDDSSTARERSATPPTGEAPIRLATISRAKSFRDRLDPLLAPPRLQALRGSRGRPSAPGTPGEPVRVYALHLAADKTTTFAQTVDNFISCTIDSKETCPHIVMRNMRQFMSGMKNYLVKHGEREFEKEVEKERLKLKSNEFLNLDAILEGVLHGAVVTPLRSHVYGLLADKFAKRGDVAQLTMGMRTAKTLPLLRLGVRPTVKIPSDAEMVVISQHFVQMQEADSPLDKLENLLSAISAIFNSMKSSSSTACNPLGADDFLPVLVMILARCNVAGAELEAELMAGLLPPQLLAGEGGYYLTTLFGAVAVLKRLASSEDQNKTLDWQTGSLVSGVTSTTMGYTLGGVARVMVPDESSGALRCVALPWRPGARARDLCRQLAHRARITNPQDYALFALRDGEETLMNDTDYPQDLVENNKGNCMLAYKRIDAKIAWPKQALQSYP